ncbi:MAG: hypothetical protein HC871_15195, partial [Rhizobiales bacterium]|nr:hypothetical protein [Hyphomicrobiales bacterium]
MDDRDGDGETAACAASAEESAGTVKASALRWLRGSRAQEGVGKEADGRAEEHSGAAADPGRSDGSDDDDLELTEALDVDDADDGADQVGKDQPAEAKPAVESAADAPAPVHRADLIYFDYDDDDDIDDFDDLGDLDGVLRRQLVAPAPVFAPAPAFAGVDLEETSSADDLDEALPVAPEPVEPESGPAAADAALPLSVAAFTPVSGPRDAADQLETAATWAAPAVAPTPEPALEADPAKAAFKLDEAAIAPLDTTLSLQPIPELQPDFCPLIARSGKPGTDHDDHPARDRADDDLPSPRTRDHAPDDDSWLEAAAFADDVHDVDDPDPDTAHQASDDEDSVEAPSPAAGDPDEGRLDDDALELDLPVDRAGGPCGQRRR